MLKTLYLFVFTTILGIGFLKSQTFSYGIKASALHTIDGYKIYSPRGEEKLSSRLGFQAGVFAQIKYLKLFFEPELLYSQLKTSSKIDIPLSLRDRNIDLSTTLGTTYPFNFFRLYITPTLRLSLKDQFLNDSVTSRHKRWEGVVKLGLGAEYSIFILDLRWERTLTSYKTPITYKSRIYTLEGSPSRIVLSLAVIL